MGEKRESVELFFIVRVLRLKAAVAMVLERHGYEFVPQEKLKVTLKLNYSGCLMNALKMEMLSMV